MTAPVLSEADLEREDVAFPRLDALELEAAKQCGHAEVFEAGENLYRAGDQPLDCFVIVTGQVEIIDPTGDDERVLLEYGAGGFTGDITVLTQRASSVSCRALTRCETIRLTGAEMRRLMVKCPSLGEKWIPALLRRREILEKVGVEGLRVFGERSDMATLHIREFLHRNGVFHHWLDTSDPAIARTVAALSGEPLRFPVVACSHNILLQNPTLPELAERTGVRRHIPDEVFDTVIVGGGPAGLGAAVYAASEGLRTLVLDNIGPGGQAGSSARIENYAGFPEGLSGRELALRTYVQALKFGAIFSAPHVVSGIKCADHGLHEVQTADAIAVKTKTVIIATGVSYRTLGVIGLSELHGSGVYYAATQVEATLCQDRPVHIIGAGNSAGQAAMYLSKFSQKVSLVVRGGNLRKNMSTYLAERVELNPRINIRLHTELREVEGTSCLEKVHLENTSTGETSIEESCGVFIFIGANPCTSFLDDAVLKDEKGFVVTGNELVGSDKWSLRDRAPHPLETSCPGIFVAGDCRSRMTKRVAFAVGDGALAVTCVHDLLGTYL
ncbi:MAG: FAD-dependent oxidoreductase [Methylacidiphilales bacterium]|nr:FAD-dependent oxidoreductase [Candidatus Methylacidiphilales bacterium]